jgi:hypothetical protein
MNDHRTSKRSSHFKTIIALQNDHRTSSSISAGIKGGSSPLSST